MAQKRFSVNPQYTVKSVFAASNYACWSKVSLLTFLYRSEVPGVDSEISAGLLRAKIISQKYSMIEFDYQMEA